MVAIHAQHARSKQVKNWKSKDREKKIIVYTYEIKNSL